MPGALKPRGRNMYKIKKSGLIKFISGQLILVMVYLIMLLIGCTQSRSSGGASNEVDVYIAGYESNGSSNIAKYWKNNVPVSLSNNNTPGIATSIFCNGPDLYIAGIEFDSNLTGPVAKIWKNGLPTSLTDGSTDAEANSIWISGNDVYVAGGEAAYAPNVGGGAEYWKNTDKIILTDGKQSATARAITVSGGDIYTVGEERQYVQTSSTTGKVVSVAKIWKNRTATILSNGNSLDSGATAVVVMGSDVYVAGWEFENTGYENRASARLWKNGQLIPLTGNEGAIATCIAVSLNDVYVCGFKYIGDTSVAMYWKNGQAIQLTDGKTPAMATSIAVFGTEVYVTGSEGNYAKYWINGVSKNLTDGRFNASANSIFVIQRR